MTENKATGELLDGDNSDAAQVPKVKDRSKLKQDFCKSRKHRNKNKKSGLSYSWLSQGIFAPDAFSAPGCVWLILCH